jgi:hypothetical protein
VHALWQNAINNGCVISTDATSGLIQPEKSKHGLRQACKKGHFFTAVVDCESVLFAYTEKHMQDFVKKLFGGFRGYLQSEASNVYDILDRGPAPDSDSDEKIKLVGCWAHCRRYFFEAGICRYPVGVQGLMRIRAIYAADNAFRKLAPAQCKLMRDQKVRPLMDSFFQWVREARASTDGRNLATRAIGYALNQKAELRRVLDDGKLPLDNTRSERSPRKIVVGRKNWMFYGSDAHAESAAAIFTIIASCRLHSIDPQQYLDEVLRILPYWPRDRYLELAPHNWPATRAKLDPDELGKRFTIVTAPQRLLLIRRGLLAPGMVARVIVQKFRFGMPFLRQEEQLEANGIELDRGTMARSTEDIGACLGAIVLACVDDARKHAFCLSTDATGVAIRPEPLLDGRRQPCRKGHFFVVLADKKHVFFEFQPKHTSAAVRSRLFGQANDRLTGQPSPIGPPTPFVYNGRRLRVYLRIWRQLHSVWQNQQSGQSLQG